MPLSRTTDSVVSAAITSSATTSYTFETGSISMCGVILPAGCTLSTLQVYVCHTKNGTYVPLYDNTNTAVYIGGNGSTLAASRAYPFPDECFPWPFMRLVGNGSDTVHVSLKG